MDSLFGRYEKCSTDDSTDGVLTDFMGKSGQTRLCIVLGKWDRDLANGIIMPSYQREYPRNEHGHLYTYTGSLTPLKTHDDGRPETLGIDIILQRPLDSDTVYELKLMVNVTTERISGKVRLWK